MTRRRAASPVVDRPARSTPTGLRLACFGDSFTFCSEVDDEDTIGVVTSAALLEHAQRNNP